MTEEEDSLDWSFWQASSVEMDGFSSSTDPAAVTRESNHSVSSCGILSEIGACSVVKIGFIDMLMR